MPPKKKPKVKKPRVTQKQKQSQKVVVNIGTDLIKKKRKYTRRPKTTSSAIVPTGGGGFAGQSQVIYPVVPQPKESPLTEDEKYFVKYLFGNKPTQAVEQPKLQTITASQATELIKSATRTAVGDLMTAQSLRERDAPRIGRASSLPPMSRSMSEPEEVPVFGVATSTPVVTIPLGSTTTAEGIENMVKREIAKPVLGAGGGLPAEEKSPEPTRGRTKRVLRMAGQRKGETFAEAMDRLRTDTTPGKMRGRPKLTPEQKEKNKQLADEKKQALKAKGTQSDLERQMMRMNDPREIEIMKNMLGGSKPKF